MCTSFTDQFKRDLKHNLDPRKFRNPVKAVKTKMQYDLDHVTGTQRMINRSDRAWAKHNARLSPSNPQNEQAGIYSDDGSFTPLDKKRRTIMSGSGQNPLTTLGGGY